MTIYYRLLGARIGLDVHINEGMRLYECDLLTLQDGCRLDAQTLRGFCVERDGYFRLAPVTSVAKVLFRTAPENQNRQNRTVKFGSVLFSSRNSWSCSVLGSYI